ncbi:NAD(P)/FAD-dependent oxidoreductase [Planosporangium thailandense]|uniref:NAD(P)/FAD-dependent oxidoreductase n=1 Tax=Planosporangium thailandense TaxID=765197 RepID=A0ABX0Y2R1_9ACTN|nr:NAD(P)/FAD-dependent oxidoreductase [Planosporangium thailandense]NJC71724.1 NAD(P)/FAD-dependent oxidoreductase [Planosporangium thailandense]
MNRAAPHILVIGGGAVGLFAAKRLEDRLDPGEADLCLVDPLSYTTYHPLLAEVAASTVEPRHVAVPLRRILSRFYICNSQVVGIRHADRTARVRLVNGEERDIPYDHVVIAPGSVSKTAPVPGLAELAVGFKTLGEAVFLRNRVITQLSLAASTTDPHSRRRSLTFVLVGASFAGVEALGELSDLSHQAIRAFRGLRREELRWILVEPGDRILPEVTPDLSEYIANVLRERGVEIRLDTTIASCVGGRIRFGGRYAHDIVEANTLIWTAGQQPNPVVEDTDLPRDDQGRLLADAYLRVRGLRGAWTGGDCAAVPDLTSDDPNALCAPTAQHAIRQGRRIADNLISELRGRHSAPPEPYRHRFIGVVAGLGRLEGVAQVYDIHLRGLPAWVLHRGYHLMMLPSTHRKMRVLTDWIIDAVFPRDITALGELEEPRKPLQTAARAPSLVTQSPRVPEPA